MIADAQVTHFDGAWPTLHLFGLEIPTYFLLISLTFCFCLFWIRSRALQREMPMVITLDLCIAILVGGFIGARLLHVVFESPGYYRQDPVRILYFWQGGFVWYGGLIFSSIAGVGYLLARKQRLAPWLEVFAPVASGGYALGRFACFFNGCCYGQVCELWPGHPFAHPTQLYSSLLEGANLILILRLEKKPSWRGHAQIFWLWLALHSIERIVIERLRADDRGPLLLGLSLSTWISALALVVAACGFKRCQVLKSPE